MYSLYILECANGSLYTGITTDVARRFAEHQQGRGGHYTRAHPPVRVCHIEACGNRSAASKRESEVKKMSRVQKLELTKLSTPK